MNTCSASKISDSEQRPKATLSQPVRVHELLGLPKSAAKSTERPRLQPVRIKDMLEADESSSRRTIKPIARRLTVAPAGTRNIRRQLYNDVADETLPNKSVLMTGASQFTADTSTNGLTNDGNQGESQLARLNWLGSKSDGKAKTQGNGRQPVRVKEILKSWEKSQTAKAAGQKSVSGGLRTKNVRRKLYSVVPSPVPSQKVARKSLAANKFHETTSTSSKVQKVVKTEARKSIKPTAVQKPSRKSSLLPPNSIRDNYVSRKSKGTIIEESSTVSSPEVEDIANSSKAAEETKLEVENDREIHSIQPDSVDRVVASSSQQNEKVFDGQAEIPRPTVIMATSTVAKNRIQSVSSESSGKSAFALSRPPLQELNCNSSMPAQRLDAVDTSLEDLLGNARADRQKSFRNSFLPCNSFLRNCETSGESLARMDRKTLAWLHGNLKLCIQTTEESLFSMRLMLKTIEDIENSCETEEESLKTNHENIPKIVIENVEIVEKVEKAEIIENLEEVEKVEIIENLENLESSVEVNREENVADLLRNSLISESFVESISTSCDRNSAEHEEEDKENFAGEFVAEKKVEKIEEKSRRRSARLAAMQQLSPKKTDDSFSRIEAELNITHSKPKSATPRKSTPAKRKQLDPRSRRSIREYMALKSCVKFLQTPDHKGLPTPKGDGKGNQAERRAADRILSRQLLDQLNDLYDDSPE